MFEYHLGTPLREEEDPLLSSQSYYEPQHNALGTDSHFGGLEARRKLEKQLLRKVDLRMSILVVIYILNYIDRNNVAAARLRGFEDDLGLEGAQFASVLSVLYFGYILMQIPSNMVLSHIDKPSIYLPCCMMAWGMISLCTGFATNNYDALFARFLLGFTEAAFYPGALFLIAKWYKRSELSQRTAFFTCGNLISNAFGSLIASGILDMMDDVLGYTAWRWLFFVEGALTVAVAMLALYVLPNFPETESISWLTPTEHELAKRRMIEDTAVSEPSGRNNGVITDLVIALTDWKVWYIALTLFFSVISTSFFMYFPTLTSTMGYNPTITLLLCAPPWLVTAAWALWVCRHSDRTGERCMHVILPFIGGIGGFLLAMSTMNTTIRYISLFLMAQSNAGAFCFLAWMSSTVSNPPAKRAVALAFINATSQSGNIVGSYIWVKAWGPTYKKSYAICIATTLIYIMMCLGLRRILERLNREMDLEDERNDERVVGLPRKSWRYHI